MTRASRRFPNLAGPPPPRPLTFREFVAALPADKTPESQYAQWARSHDFETFPEGWGVDIDPFIGWSRLRPGGDAHFTRLKRCFAAFVLERQRANAASHRRTRETS